MLNSSINFVPDDACSDVYDISSYCGDLNDISGILRTSIEWIMEHKRAYRCSSQTCKDRINNLSKALDTNDNDCMANSLILFSESFINNPFIYEWCTDKSVLRKKAVSNDIMCYFVKIGEIILPLGALDILKPDITLTVTNEFIEDRNIRFKAILDANRNYLANFLFNNPDPKKNFFKFTSRLLITSAITISAIIFVLKRLVFGVEWAELSHYSKNASNIFNAIGFLTEKSYNINHNSIAGFLCVLYSLIWLIIILRLLKPISYGIQKTSKDFEKILIYTKCENLKKKADNLIAKQEKNIEYIQNHLAELRKLQILPTQGKITTNANKVIRLLNAPAKPLRTGKLPKKFTLALLVLMILFTADFNAALESPEFTEKLNTYSDKISCYIDNGSLYATKKYTVTASSHLYTLPVQESLVLLDIEPGDYFTVTETREDDSLKKIKIHTKYGHIAGWLFNPSLSEYTLKEEDGYTAIAPKEATASSIGMGSPENICDGKSYTLWGENGRNGSIGEYVTFNYAEPAKIKLIMIQSGNCYSDYLFSVSSRPIGFSMEFYKNGEMQDVCHITLDDTQKKQYIHLNYPVEADSIRFTINEATEGTLNKNSYITEITTYSEAEIQN